MDAPPGGSGDRAPVLDRKTFDRLAEIVGPGEDGIGELVELYRASAPGTVEQMRQAVAAGDMDALARAAHKLKGESMTLGAMAVRETCRQLEEDANGGQLQEAGNRVDEVEALVDETLAQLP